MSEQVQEQQVDGGGDVSQVDAQQQSAAQEQQSKTFDAEYVEKLRRESAEYRTKLRKLEQDAERQRKASMSEAERAVAEAESRGRLSATAEFGKRLAAAEFKAKAAQAGADADGFFDLIDVSKFVGEDGEPDSKLIDAAVKRLPKRVSDAASFDGGARRAGTAPDFNAQIHEMLGARQRR